MAEIQGLKRFKSQRFTIAAERGESNAKTSVACWLRLESGNPKSKTAESVYAKVEQLATLGEQDATYRVTVHFFSAGTETFKDSYGMPIVRVRKDGLARIARADGSPNRRAYLVESIEDAEHYAKRAHARIFRESNAVLDEREGDFHAAPFTIWR